MTGAVAQLGERCVRNAEVEGSTPFRSTLWRKDLRRSGFGRLSKVPETVPFSSPRPAHGRIGIYVMMHMETAHAPSEGNWQPPLKCVQEM